MYQEAELGELTRQSVRHITLDAQTNDVPESAVGRFVPHCSSCQLRNCCVAACIDDEHIGQMEHLVSHWRMVYRGEAIFRVGDGFHSLYALRSGSVKTVTDEEHVSGFFMAGETLGLGAISTGEYDCAAIALEDSAVCVIPFATMETLCRQFKPLQQHFHKMLSNEILREARQMALMSGTTAEQRVAAFLIDLSNRLQRRGYSPREFTLRMTRDDIGSYLGVKLETVSRTFSRFRQEGIIRVKGKHIELFDLDGLKSLSN